MIGRALDGLGDPAPEVGLMLGLYHYWVNYDYEAALPELDRVLALQPGNEQAWAIRGWVLRRAGRWDEALESLKKAAALNPNSLNYLSSVVETLWALNRFEEAQAWLRTADSRFPDNIVVAGQKAAISVSMTGNAEPLIAVFRKAVSLENPALIDRLIHVFLETNFADPQRALVYLDKWAPDVVDVQYNFWPADLLRAYVLFAAGRSDEARDFAARALPVIEDAQRFEPNEPDIEKANSNRARGRPPGRQSTSINITKSGTVHSCTRDWGSWLRRPPQPARHLFVVVCRSR